MKKTICYTFISALIISVYFLTFACSPVTKSEDKATTTTTTINTIVGTWTFVTDYNGSSYLSNPSGYADADISSTAIKINADNTAIMGAYSGGTITSPINYTYTISDTNRLTLVLTSTGYNYIYDLIYENNNKNAKLTVVSTSDPGSSYTINTRLYCSRK